MKGKEKTKRRSVVHPHSRTLGAKRLPVCIAGVTIWLWRDKVLIKVSLKYSRCVSRVCLLRRQWLASLDNHGLMQILLILLQQSLGAYMNNIFCWKRIYHHSCKYPEINRLVLCELHELC